MAASQTLLSDQLQLTVGYLNTQDDSKEQATPNTKQYSAKCICGNAMSSMKLSEYGKNFAICKVCGFRCTNSEQDMFVCNNEEIENILYHPYIICMSCLNNTNDFNAHPIKDMYKSELLYFIYNNNTLKGPLSTDEIIKRYVRKQIKSGQMWVKNAATNASKWYQFTIPNKWNDYRELTFDNPKRLQMIEEYKFRNREIKQHLPVLYENLVENVINNRINQIVLPTDIPLSAKKLSKIAWITNIFGKILVVILGIVIILHCIVSTTIVAIFCILSALIFALFGQFNKRNILQNHCVIYLIFILCLSGMVFSPILLIYAILSYTQLWIGIQSWMIGYIVWGIISWLLPMTFVFVLIKQNYKIINIYTQLILLIIGIDFGGWDIDDIGNKQDTLGLFVVLMIFPSLSSALPAAVTGFIANFILEEKFLIKCNDNTNESDASSCVLQQGNGCCEIVSNHEMENSYAFIGGLASNIIAVWAIIRIIGYFIVNSYPSLAMFAKRMK